LIIVGAVLFIGLPDKTAAHCLFIAGLVQLIIAVVIFIFGKR